MKVTYIDNFDSFANTIAAYFEIAGADVTMFKSDSDLDVICDSTPDLILLGPGPNSPTEAGNYLEVLDKFHKEYPIFGICLGFQAMMHYFGMPVSMLNETMHGAASKVHHDQNGIFEGIEQDADFARYHSLGVQKVPDSFQELAHCIGANKEHYVMAAQHKELPIAGVQFHPESVLSTANKNGMRLVENVLTYLRKQ